MPTRRLLVFGLFAALAVLQTGCCGRIRQCIANRWNYFHGCGACAPCATPCCTPAFKVPAPAPIFPALHHPPAAGCSTCGIAPDAGPVVFTGPMPGQYGPGGVPVGPSGVPTIGQPMPLLNGPTIQPLPSGVPSPMPGPKSSN